MIEINYSDPKFVGWLRDNHPGVFYGCLQEQSYEPITTEILIEYAKEMGFINRKEGKNE